MIKKIILPRPFFSPTSNYPETVLWYLRGNELRFDIISLGSISRSHRLGSETGCLLCLGRFVGEGGREVRLETSSHTYTQRPAHRDSGAHSGGEKHLPLRQVNHGHAIIVGGLHVQGQTSTHRASRMLPPHTHTHWLALRSWALILQRKCVSMMEGNHLAASRYCRLNCIAAECCNPSQSSLLSSLFLSSSLVGHFCRNAQIKTTNEARTQPTQPWGVGAGERKVCQRRWGGK